ncbi:ABC transporter G family member 7 isoform X2 [Tanacetum coccineum]
MGHGSAHGSAHGSDPIEADSPVEELPPIKAKKPSKRASKTKKNDNKESSKEWTTAEEIVLCKGWCDVSENSEKGNTMKSKGFWQTVINYFRNEIGSTRGGSCDLNVYQKACAEYELVYGHPFTLEPCWNILKGLATWKEIEMPSFYKKTKGRKKSKTSETTSGSAQGSLNLNDEAVESEEETQEERSIGRDRAKKKSSASFREGYSFVDLLKNRELDIQEAARRGAADLKREKLEIQHRALELAEKKKRNKDILFYNSVIDSSLPSTQQQKLQELKDKIKEYYNLDY